MFFFIKIEKQLRRRLYQAKRWHICKKSCNELQGLIIHLKLVCFPKLSLLKCVPNCQRQKRWSMQQQFLRGLVQPSKPKIKNTELIWDCLLCFPMANINSIINLQNKISNTYPMICPNVCDNSRSK